MSKTLLLGLMIVFILILSFPLASAQHTYDTKATYQTTVWNTANPGNLSYTAGSYAG